MRKKTKKSFLVAIGVALCLAFGGTAFAIDSDSLESRTTEGLYDRTDPYDLAMEAGILYKLDRWRLYTNLSGYEEGDSFLIGTSGKLGAGSIAFFYETNKDEYDLTETDASYYRWESTTAPTAVSPNYDGTYDFLWDDADWDKNESITEENNFYAAYSIDLGGVSVGLSYAPEFGKYERSLDHEGILPDLDDPPATLWNSEWFWGLNVSPGWGYGDSWGWTDYDPADHTQYDAYIESESFSGKQKADITEHPFKLQSQIHIDDHWHLLVGVGYASIEEEDDLSGVYSYSERYEDTVIGELETINGSICVDGSLDEDYEGDEWSIYLEPVYEVNDMVSLRMDLHYDTEDGDSKGGRVGTLNGTETYRPMAGDPTETWTCSETWNSSSKGDSEEESWAIEPRVYLTFDKVRFSLGAGYYYSEEEWDGTERADKSVRYTYDDGDGVADGDDWTFVGSWTGYENYDGTEKTTGWRFPVATEFDITDKLTLRAGAAYYRTHIKFKEKWVEGERINENYTETDGTGTVTDVGPQEYYAMLGADPEAYDADAHGSTDTYKSDRTLDSTTYHLGLGYTFTENLKCDLMWSGSDGAVDTDMLYASVTLTF